VSSTDQVVHDVRRRGIATRATKPFAASETLDNTARGMNTTISAVDRLVSVLQYQGLCEDIRASMRRQLLLVLESTKT
jgi:hypothetical protein